MRHRFILVFAAVSLVFLAACSGTSDDSPDTTTVTLSAETAELLGGSEGDEVEVTAAPEDAETVEADPAAELEGDLATLTDDLLKTLGKDPSAKAAVAPQEFRAVANLDGTFEFEIPARWGTLNGGNEILAGVADPETFETDVQNFITVSRISEDPSESYVNRWTVGCSDFSAQVKPYSVGYVTGFSRIHTDCPSGGSVVIMAVQLSTGDQPNFSIVASMNSPESVMALARALGTLKSLK